MTRLCRTKPVVCEVGDRGPVNGTPLVDSGTSIEEVALMRDAAELTDETPGLDPGRRAPMAV